MSNLEKLKDLLDKLQSNPYYNELLEEIQEIQNERKISQEMNDKMESICNPLTLDDLTSRVRISTITCLCSLLKDKDSKKSINLTRLYKSIDESELPQSGQEMQDLLDNWQYKVVGVILGKEDPKGYVHSQRKIYKPVKKTNLYNQLTFNVHLTEGKMIKVKVFNNGNLQLTGVPSPILGIKTCEIVKQKLEYLEQKLKNTNQQSFLQEGEKFEQQKLKIAMMNTDFQLPTGIDRQTLTQILQDKKYIVQFDPEAHPGVKLEFMWNGSKEIRDGICRCKVPCPGSGTKKYIKNGQKVLPYADENLGEVQKINGKQVTVISNFCKVITVMIFASGKVVITGGNNLNQVFDAYTTITNIINENFEKVANPQITGKPRKRFVRIPKKYIVVELETSDEEDREDE